MVDIAGRNDSRVQRNGSFIASELHPNLFATNSASRGYSREDEDCSGFRIQQIVTVIAQTRQSHLILDLKHHGRLGVHCR